MPPRPPRRVIVLLGALVLVGAVVSWATLDRADDDPTARLTVGWGGSEGVPSCVYDPANRTVEAKIAIDGTAPRPEEVTVTVTAYADENTSEPVGSGTRTAQVEGTVHLPVLVTFPVDAAPHVGEDGETACKLSVAR